MLSGKLYAMYSALYLAFIITNAQEEVTIAIAVSIIDIFIQQRLLHWTQKLQGTRLKPDALWYNAFSL